MTQKYAPNTDRSIIPTPAQLAEITRPLDRLPAGVRYVEGLGVVVPDAVKVQRIHIDEFICHPRAIKLANGEFLLFYPAGPQHYAWARKASQGNRMYLRRSRDGWNWSEAEVPWDPGYSQHSAIPFVPRGSNRLYIFGTEPRHDIFDGEENAAIGFRTSDDGGHTWSDVEIIRPVNAPDFQGMSAMRMCETTDGSWLLGSHLGHWSGDEPHRSVTTQQYILRSEDQGKTWTLLPDAPPRGWFVPEFKRMDEGRPIELPDNRALFMIRTPTGYLWESRSADGGRTWTEPKAMPLAHPDAPPMLFHLDSRTLIAFYHNRKVQGHLAHELRIELWFALSEDEGKKWSEPRFVMANACEPALLNSYGMFSPMVSYTDLLVDGDQLHLFVDHQSRQVLQASFTRAELMKFPTRAELCR